jgi:hypothetical protein
VREKAPPLANSDLGSLERRDVGLPHYSYARDVSVFDGCKGEGVDLYVRC